jgi:bacillithiol biosynthesis deacetylase BshB1
MSADVDASTSAADLLVFGPHADDLEIGLGGTIARLAAAGASIVLCDLTQGELASNGTPGARLAEAAAAAEVLGVRSRENLRLPDGGIAASADQVRAVVDAIRRHRPRTIAAPFWRDRHPDHVAASRLVRLAAFRSGLRRVETDRHAWRADWICYYFINDAATPSFVVDVSDHYQRKRDALDCHRSQLAPRGGDAVSTRLTSPEFRQLIESRDAQFGALAGVRFAEGVVVREPVVRADLFKRPS